MEPSDEQSVSVGPSTLDYRRTLDDAESSLDGIDRALDRLRKGTYHLCEVCGDPIEAERLELNPLGSSCERHLPLDA